MVVEVFWNVLGVDKLKTRFPSTSNEEGGLILFALLEYKII